MSPERAGWFFPYLVGLPLAGERVLELGSGLGEDAASLISHGAVLVASELDPARTRNLAAGVPDANVVRLDHSHPLPFGDSSFDAVVASLTLHYMDWERTVSAFAEIRRVLVLGGALLFRVNASDDFEHGAGAGEELEPGFFRVLGRESETKRFFDEAMVRACLADGFEIESLRPRKIQRRGLTKSTWECLARRDG